MPTDNSPAPEGVSVVLLSKNCSQPLAACLYSLKPFLLPQDEVVVVDTGSTDDTPETAEARGARVFRHPELCVPGMLDLVRKYLPDQADECSKTPQFKDGFLADFAAARSLADSHATHDLCFWLDSDDILVGGAELRQMIAQRFSSPGTERSTIFMQYDYTFDEDGVACVQLWRERVYRKSHFEWKGVCHESAVTRDGTPAQAARAPADVCRIEHRHGQHHTFSDIRNYAILRHAHDTAAWKDPRWIFYLGNACRGLSRWSEAIHWYRQLLKRSGSKSDRFDAALNIGIVLMLQGRPWRAVDWFFQANKINSSEPRAWFAIARAHADLRRWKEVLLYSSLGRALNSDPALDIGPGAIDPNQYDFYPSLTEAQAAKELGDFPLALSKAEEALRLRPNHPVSQDLLASLRSDFSKKQFVDSVRSIASYALSHEAANSIIHSIRPEVRKEITDLQLETYCTKTPGSITFLCGPVPEPWDATSEDSGIGGSEKMVLLLARAFAARGRRVTVYGSPKPGNAYKTFDGVVYKPYQAFNPFLERETLIVWRHWDFLDLPLRAKKIYMDLHDVQNPADYTPTRLAKLSGIFFKSNFHHAPVADCCQGKAIITRNGIDPSHFARSSSTPPRSLRKIIYCSSADRGLLSALRLFLDIKKEVPDSEFHIFYGFTKLYLDRAAQVDYQHFGDLNCSYHMLDYMEDVADLAQISGALFRGRCGHKALAQELLTSSVLLYPTRFDEISCMAAMEAQAAGCIPVVSNAGALPETLGSIPTYDPSDTSAFVSRVVEILSGNTDLRLVRDEMQTSALKRFSIHTLADSWLAEFDR